MQMRSDEVYHGMKTYGAHRTFQRAAAIGEEMTMSDELQALFDELTSTVDARRLASSKLITTMPIRTVGSTKVPRMIVTKKTSALIHPKARFASHSMFG